MQAVFNQIDRTLSRVLGNEVVSTALTVFLVLYAVMAAPNLPPFLARWFDNPIFRVLVLFLVLLLANYDPTVALLTAIGFVISLQTLNRYRMLNMGLALTEPDAAARLQHAKANVPQVGGPSLLGSLGGLGTALAGYVPQINHPVAAATPVQVQAPAPATQYDMSVSDINLADQTYASPDSCAKPQPMPQDLVLPPQPDIPEEVAAVMNPNCQYMGPQGLQYPQGFGGVVNGAPYGTCDSEL